MGISQEIIDEIIRRIKSIADPDRIILFGSAAADKMTKDSDLDLLVVEPAPDNPRKQSVRIGDALRGLGYPIDVIVIPAQRFEETKNLIGGIAYPANKYGKVIYPAHEGN